MTISETITKFQKTSFLDSWRKTQTERNKKRILKLRDENLENRWGTPEQAYNTWKEGVVDLIRDSLHQIPVLEKEYGDAVSKYSDAHIWIKPLDGDVQKIEVNSLGYSTNNEGAAYHIFPKINGESVYETTYADRHQNSEIKDHFENNPWLWEIVRDIMKPKVTADRLREMGKQKSDEGLSIEDLIEVFAEKGITERETTTVFDQAALFMKYANELNDLDVDYKYINTSYDNPNDISGRLTTISVNNNGISIYNHMDEKILDKSVRSKIEIMTTHPEDGKINRAYVKSLQPSEI